MSKSKLRKEYESRFGVVDGTLKLYDDKGNPIYNETSNGYWAKYKFDDNNNVVYYESSKGYWLKYEYDAKGNMIYHEDKFGVFIDGRVEFTAGWKPAKDITRNLILSGGLTESLRANRIVT